jgi:CheY-like chemotaxis protein
MESRAPRILYVDDDRVHLYILEKLLKKDVEITVANNGYLAMEYINLVSFDLILLDIDLGTESPNGATLMRRIQASDKNPDTPIYALTALNRPEQSEALLAEGFDKHFAKPLDYASLKNVILEDIQAVMAKRELG